MNTLLPTLTVLILTALLQTSFAQKIDLTKAKLDPNKVYMSVERLGRKMVVKVAKDSTVKDEMNPPLSHYRESTLKTELLT